MSECRVDGGAPHTSLLCRIAGKVDSISMQNALLWGVAWLIISTIGGWYYCIMPSGVVDYEVVGKLPLLYHLMFNVVVWMVSASVLYVVILLHNRGAKLTDTYARLLFAHWPATLLLLPVVVVGKVDYAMFTSDFMTLLHSNALTAVLMALYSFVVVVWMLYWSYRAFRRSAGGHSRVTWPSFIISYYLASRLCVWTIEAICRGIEIG